MRDRLRRRRVWLTTRKASNTRPGRWCIEWYDDAGVRRKLAYRTREEQLTAQRLKFEEINSWMAPPRARQWPLVLMDHGRTHALLSRKHVSQLATTLRYFTQLLGPATADGVSPKQCADYFAARLAGLPPPVDRHGQPLRDAAGELMKRTPPSIATLHRERRELTGFFNWCIGNNYADRNPLAGVKLPAAPKRLPRATRSDTWVRLLEACSGPAARLDDAQAWHVLILLAVATGVRQAPLLNTYYSLPLENTMIATLARMHRKGFCIVHLADEPDGVGLLFSYTSKTAKEEVFGLPPMVNDRLARRISDLGEDNRRPASVGPASAALFPWGGVWGRKGWERLCAAAGTVSEFHSLRAAAGTQAAIAQAREAGRRQLGHHSAETTRAHYLDAAAVARAVALQQAWPELPPLPRYAPWTLRDIRRGRPGGT